MQIIIKYSDMLLIYIITGIVLVDSFFLTSTTIEQHQYHYQRQQKHTKNDTNNIVRKNYTKIINLLSSPISENRNLFQNENESIFAKNLNYDAKNFDWNSDHNNKIQVKDDDGSDENNNFDFQKYHTIRNSRDVRNLNVNYFDNLSPIENDEINILRKNQENILKLRTSNDDDVPSSDGDLFNEKYFEISDDDMIEEVNDDEKTQLRNLYTPTKINIKQEIQQQQKNYAQNKNQIYQQHQHRQQVFNRRHVIEKLVYTKEIIIKQGRVKGIIRTMHPQSGLKDVDQFLGLPYAEAPVGSRRFMPPGAPLPWNGLKIASHLPPVCPQNLPENDKTTEKFSKGRQEQLLRLFAYLKNESEDCLYLNVYVPKRIVFTSDKVQKYPVIVYVHGESYEWNSGNPYDGSILASYGQVIVVTLNYRLGVLGFLRPGISEHIVTNFGLLDQIAALQWVKDNIESFGGDSNLVTLMGHGIGAACVNFLMLSPVAKGLFHRAILMSGSAMSDWAMSNKSLAITMQVAHGLNCPLSDNDDKFVECLRKKRYQDIVKVPKKIQQFATAFGPIVDGLVIPNQPNKVMEQYTDLFSRYDLLFGVTEVESYHMLDAFALKEGLRENERDSRLRAYMEHRFEIRPDLALAATLNKYTDIYNNPTKASTQEHRDVILDIFSDARVVAPIVQTGIFHAKVNPRSYMYVFGHNSEAGAYSHLSHSIHGEELAFVFGAPLAPAGPFPQKYSMQEKLLSEAVMQYWTNFAKTGNPKAPWRDYFINLHPLEWERYDIDWPEFNSKNQCFVNIGIPPSLGYRYRETYMKFWYKQLPDELKQISVAQPQPFIHFFPSNPVNQLPRGGTLINPPNEIIPGYVNNFPIARNNRIKEDSLRTLKLLLQDPLGKAENMYNAQPTSKVIKSLPEPYNTKMLAKTGVDSEEDTDNTLFILIGVIILVLAVNVIIGAIYLIRKKKKNMAENKKLGILSYDGTTVDSDLKKPKSYDGDDSYVLGIVRKSSKSNRRSPLNGFKITRQMSTSTVDGNVKVSDWISHDMVDFGSKSSRVSTPSISFKRRSFLKKPKKVSVAIDATPQARSNSILRQEPIEVTKIKNDNLKNIIICQDVEIAEELLNPNETDFESIDHRVSMMSSSSNKESSQDLTASPPETYRTTSTNDDFVAKFTTINYCLKGTDDEKVTSFISGDINVTSRDEDYIEKDPLTPEEQLQLIKRRNFPKVLPDYPGEDEENLPNSVKRKSLPPSSLNLSFSSKTPPLPPPRTSTLGRYPSIRRYSNSITTSPLMLAKDYPEEEEPKITENTLIVGPLLPKSQESIYCTFHQKKRSMFSNDNEHNKTQTESTPNLLEPQLSVIKSPQLISFQSLPSNALMTTFLQQENQQTLNNSNLRPLESVHRVFPIKCYDTKIPQLKHTSSYSDVTKSNTDSSSSDTNSSIVTVKTKK